MRRMIVLTNALCALAAATAAHARDDAFPSSTLPEEQQCQTLQECTMEVTEGPDGSVTRTWTGNDGIRAGDSTGPNGSSSWREDANVSIARPAITGRSVAIDQVGSGNVATVNQTPARALARVRQTGDNNRAGIGQSGTAQAFAAVEQTGNANQADIAQSGLAGANTLYVTQTGTANIANAGQVSDGGDNAAALVQNGTGNTLALTQQGNDNQAILTQEGDGNVMTAAQLGGGNRLVWTQQGSGLSNLGITQGGGQAMTITQSR